jgi:hypothetical protein
MFELFNADALHRFPAFVVAEHRFGISAHSCNVRLCFARPADQVRQDSQDKIFNSIVLDVIHHHNRLGRRNSDFCSCFRSRGSHHNASAAMPL